MNNDKIVQAMAIKNGKIVEIGANQQILNKYSANKTIDAKGKEIYPGFIDAHGHIMSYINQKLSVDLTACTSYDEMILKVKSYQKENNYEVIIGHGWDQSIWGKQEGFPDNKSLNKHFPDIPVCLYRIDGHSALLNDCMLDLIQIDTVKQIKGGEIIKKDNKLTGILIDNALSLLKSHLPKYPFTKKLSALKEIEKELLSFGITGVHEAGISNEDLIFLKSVINKNILSLNIYAMLLPDKKNINFAKKHGIYTNKNLSVRSFKVYGDGALGSGGALLKEPYINKLNYNGLLLTPINEIKELSMLCEQIGYQLNTHAIGDSMVNIIMDIYKELNEVNKDHRSRIEHIQMIDQGDLINLGNYGIYPSIQPSHAVSDYRWVENKIGKNRLSKAYAYKSILENSGIICVGSDFPFGNLNPFKTIYAGVNRKNSNEQPNNGFLPNESIKMEDCIKGMTIWAAISSFNEKEFGSIEKGKDATFTILEKPLVVSDKYLENNAWKTFILGKEKYCSDEF